MLQVKVKQVDWNLLGEEYKTDEEFSKIVVGIHLECKTVADKYYETTLVEYIDTLEEITLEKAELLSSEYFAKLNQDDRPTCYHANSLSVGDKIIFTDSNFKTIKIKVKMVGFEQE